MNYCLMTDSDSDLHFSYAKEHNIPVVRMPYTLDGVEYFDDNGATGQEKVLFERMRQGSVPSTSLLSKEAYLEYFGPILKERDLLFIAFSSQMSATIENVYAAREELLKTYPNRQFEVVDTLAISGPMAIYFEQICERYEQGMGLRELAKWARDNRMRTQAWFTVDNLVYLKRGGRISSTSAAFGTLLDVKPILCLSRFGKIEAFGKVKGRKKAIRTLVEKVQENRDDWTKEVLVLHADDEESGNLLAKTIKEQLSIKTRIQMVGPVIGAHCGPGTLAVCFLGKERPV